MRISNWEKQLVRGTINMFLDRSKVPDAVEIEYMVSRYTGNMDCDHRYDLEQFVKHEIHRILTR